MSILTEYEEIRKELSPKEINDINNFLESHPKYLLSDVYYNRDVYIKFETWQAKQDLSKIKYYYKGMNRDPFIRLSFEDMMKALQDYPKLKECVLSYAQNSFRENPLFDKKHTISAIKQMNVDILYNHDTEVREGFCESFDAGLKSYMKDLLECIASNKQNLKKSNQER